ncbi:MAG: hypothetical protein WAU91_09630 [Desulfatitalea sp.]
MDPLAQLPPAVFFVGQPPTPITASDEQWRLPLPAGRADGSAAAVTVSYGEYFTAVGDYLAQEGAAVLTRVAQDVLGRGIAPAEVDGVQVHLVKHGALYHPARVTLLAGPVCVPLVLNVAVSPAGRERLAAEVTHLKQLGAGFAEQFIPQVYGWGHGRIGGRAALPMFAAQWLTGFHELHPTAGPGGRRPWSVWDPDEGPWQLSDRQVADFFRQAVFILTYYFDPHTLGAILAWHHAAGDFVVRGCGEAVEVRLITVRRYEPLFQLEEGETLSLERLLEALAVFFLRTSLWMRLDRMDGVGDLVWADEACLAPMWAGFVQGLERMAQRNDFPAAFVPGVLRYFARHTPEDLVGLGETIIARHPAGLPEVALMRRHLLRHAARLAEVVGAER